MGRKDACGTKLPVDQYRKQIGKQDYKKTKSVLKATQLKAEAKKNSSGFKTTNKPMRRTKGGPDEGTSAVARRQGDGDPAPSMPSVLQLLDAFLVIAAILLIVLCVYAFFYLNLSTEIDLDVDVD